MKLWRSRKTPRVVFVHAGGVDGRMWRPLGERLDGMRLLMPDLRGHGGTPLPPGEYAHADDLLGMLDDLRVKQATFVGASFGGWVALQLATKAPERVKALALLASTNLDRADDEWSPEIRSFWEREDKLIEARDIEGAVALGLRTWKPRPAVRDLVAEMTRDAFELQKGAEAQPRELPVDLGAISVPTLVVSGGKDPMPDFAQIADHYAASIDGAERAVIKNAGHLIALERPDETAELLGPWLKRVSA
ncbi:MAG TPA: alpha/beta hydrolase [Solirubrobacteraceae bacterium]